MSLKDFRRIYPLMTDEARLLPVAAFKAGQISWLARAVAATVNSGILTVRKANSDATA